MNKIIKKIYSRIKAILKRIIGKTHKSETAKCRHRLAKFCTGNGADLGFGGDAITENAIRIDYPSPYASTEDQSVQLGGDCCKLHWFQDKCLEFIYSSHLLEDFEDTQSVLSEWLRVLKPGGLLIIFCPDEQIYRRHCQKTGQYYNQQHKHADFSLEKVKGILRKMGQSQIIHENPLVDKYSWELVIKKV